MKRDRDKMELEFVNMNKIIELSKELKEYIIESFNRNKKALVSYKANEIVTDLDKRIEVGIIK